MNGKHLVIVAPQMRAATFALRDRCWTMVQGHPES